MEKRDWRKPNFFIIGAPKCGTTALATYLGEHELICMSEPKEPHYFSSDIWHQQVTSEAEYSQCFSKANHSHIAIGEASVFYIYSNVAAKKILDFNSEAKFIVMLRNPIDLVHAYHEQLVFNGEEDIVDFHSAWLAQRNRAYGNQLPPHFEGNPLIFQYKELGLLSKRLRKLFDIVGRKNVHLIIMDDMKQDMQQVYNATLDFLKVPHDNRTAFPKINESKEPVSRALLKATRLIGRIRRQLGLPRIGIHLIEKIYKMNTRPRARDAISSQFRAELVEEFRSEVNDLSALLGRDLTHWLN